MINFKYLKPPICVKEAVEFQNNKVITTAEVKHQAQVAPITKGSRKVRYIENTIPNNVNPQRLNILIFRHFLSPKIETSLTIPIARYPSTPNNPIGISPKSEA